MNRLHHKPKQIIQKTTLTAISLLTIIIISTICLPILPVVASSETSTQSSDSFEFNDNFESYSVGTNPTNVYDYVEYSGWNPQYSFPPTDLYQVGLLGSNQVLKYNFNCPSSHFPYVIKLYKQQFSQLDAAGATFYYNAPTMGCWTLLRFGYQDNRQGYVIYAHYSNQLIIYKGTNSTFDIIGSANLWQDKHILDLSHRIEVRREGGTIIATITRRTNQQISVTVNDTTYLGEKQASGWNLIGVVESSQT